MSAGPGVAEFVLARLAEVEQEARAAVGRAVFHQNTGEWVARTIHDSYGPRLFLFALAENDARTQVADLTTAWEADERAVHIARHDPARILADVAAKRAIVALHHTSEGRPHMAALGYNDAGRDPSCSSRDYPEISDDCETLLNLAALDATHPDFDPAWRDI